MHSKDQDAKRIAQEIHGLQETLDQIKTDLSQQMDTIQARIHRLEDQLPGLKGAEPSFEQPAAPPAQAPVFKAPKDQDQDWDREQGRKQDRKQPPVWAPATNKAAAPKKETLKTMGAVFLENILPIFGPAATVFEKLFAVYSHYRSQGKAPVFLMTIAGILTLIMGFGYLFQYSFSQYLGPVGKVIFGFGVSAGIGCCGMAVYRKRPGMADFGSSLIGLGMIIAYLCAYFTGPHYDLLSHGGTFVLLACLTAIAYYLALVFQTRVVGVISLLGGALAPVFMAGAAQAPLVYLAYVWILVLSTLFLSRRINWPVLAHMAMVVSFLVIEFVIFTWTAPGMSPGLVGLVHLFFYAFGLYYGWEIVKTCGLTRPVAALSCANLFYFLFALEQMVHHSRVLGGLYFLNSGLLAALFFCLPAIVKKVKGSGQSLGLFQVMVLLCMGVLAGFGILSVTGPGYLGLVWGVEALVLLYMGAKYDLFQVRVESFVILVISLLSCIWQSWVWLMDSLVPMPQLIEFHLGYGWMNLVVATVLLGAFVYTMTHWKHLLTKAETTWLYGNNELLSGFISLAFLSGVGLIWGEGVWLLGIFPMLFHIFRARAGHLPVTEGLGLLHLLLPVVPVFTSALMVDSLYFSDQSIIGKVARIEAFFSLYLIAEVYRRYYPKSVFHKISKGLGQVFFAIIPVFFLPAVWHHHIHYFPVSLWLSCAICLGLLLRGKTHALELRLLVGAAGLASITACVLVQFFGWQGHGFMALTAGLAFYSLVLFYWQGLRENPAGSKHFAAMRETLIPFFTQAFYYLGVFIFVLVYGSFGSAALALTLWTVYFGILCFNQSRLVPLKQSGSRPYAIAAGSAAVMISAGLPVFNSGPDPVGMVDLFSFYGGLGIICLGVYGILVHLTLPHLKTIRKQCRGELGQFRIFHILTGLTYLGGLSRWFSSGFGPALSVVLVLHATLILFLTLKKRFAGLASFALGLYLIAAAKIIFLDMNAFSLAQKMIAFIIIGVVLLGSAYYYQRLKTADPRNFK